MNERDPELVQEQIGLVLRATQYQVGVNQMLAEHGMSMLLGVHGVPGDVFDALPGGPSERLWHGPERATPFWTRRVGDVPVYTDEPPAEWDAESILRREG